MPIYTTKDSEEFDAQLNAMLHQPKVEEDALTFTEEVKPEQTQPVTLPEGLPTHISQIQHMGRRRIPKPESFLFGSTKGKISFSIDRTIFAPVASVALAGAGFEKAYAKQLNDIIFAKEDEVNPEHLIHLVILFKLIETKRYPILLTASRFTKLLPRIRKTLNDYIISNFDTLNEICNMLESTEQFKMVDTSNDG